MKPAKRWTAVALVAVLVAGAAWFAASEDAATPAPRAADLPPVAAATPVDPEPTPLVAPAAAVRGVVRDPAGAPVAGAFVVAARSDDDARARNNHATTDAAGRYEIDDLPFGCSLTVTASKRGFLDSEESGGERSVLLTDGDVEPDQDFVLRPAPRLEILVLDADGRPAADAKVSGETRGETGTRTFKRRVDADGRCVVDVAQTGTCTLVVASEHAPTAYDAAECVAGSTTQVTVQLFAGRVVSGVVVDDLDDPVVGATLTATSAESTTERTSQSDADGTFRLQALTDCAYVVTASVPDHVDAARKVVAGDDDEVRLVLRRYGSVVARVRSSGREVRGAVTTFFLGPRRRGFDEPDPVFEGGDVRMSLAPGTWAAMFSAPGFAHATRFFKVAPGAETRLDDILLEQGVTVFGRVVDELGQPVAGAIVSGDVSTAVSTDEAGRFSVADMPAGALRLSLHVRAAGFVDEPKEYTLTSSAHPIVVTLRRSAVLNGFVRNASGEAGQWSAYVFVTRLGYSTVVAQATVDSHGAFSMWLPGGRYRVYVDDTRVKGVDLRDGEVKTVDIVADR